MPTFDKSCIEHKLKDKDFATIMRLCSWIDQIAEVAPLSCKDADAHSRVLHTVTDKWIDNLKNQWLGIKNWHVD